MSLHSLPGTPRRHQYPLFQRALPLCGLAILLLQLAVLLPRQWARTDRTRDVVIYYEAARAVREARPLYVFRPHYGPHTKPFDYLYPPHFAALCAPLGQLSFVSFARVWLVLTFCAFWIYAWSLARLVGVVTGKRTLIEHTLVAGLILQFWPGTHAALSLGQADPLLWMLWGVALAGFGRGALLSASMLVKVYGVWPLLVAISRDRRLIIPALMVSLAALALGIGMCGVDSYIMWARAVLPVAGQGTFDPDNWSLSMGVLRLARWLGWEYTTGPLPQLARSWLSLAAFSGPALTWWWLRVRRPAASSEWQIAWVGTTAALCAPLCWSSYLPLLLAPLALMLKVGMARHARTEEMEI